MGIAAAFANASLTAAALAKTCRTAAAVINASLGIGTGSGLAPRRAWHSLGSSESMIGGFGGFEEVLTGGGGGAGVFAGTTRASH